MSSQPIFHICKRSEWEAAVVAGVYSGSSQDLSDGYIHFSTRDQIVESAAKHRAGQGDLILVTVDASRLGEALTWETARNQDLFPHLYGHLDLSAVLRVDDLPLGEDSRHVFPEDFPPIVG